MEKMNDFFASRVEGYDEHMLSDVGGCREGYIKMAELVPKSCINLLDLGCGTGLELDEIFKVLPDVKVTGIDMTKAMLLKLKEKHSDKSMELICGDYFKVDLGKDKYDCAVSFQTMHHFSHDDKVDLYKRIYKSLKTGSMYIECDYMVEKQENEDHFYAENKRIRRELNIPDNEFYHYDTPCTIENQISMFKASGFNRAEKIFRIENTTIIIAYK